MWETIKGFLRRHRRKFFITGAVVGGVYLLSRYARWRFAEWQRQQEMEYVEQARKQHHFESNQRTCTITLFSLVPNLRDALMEKLNCEAITGKLRERPSNKLELWEQLKVLSFTRTIASVYSSCMLFVFLRVQLNIIGGYLYLDSMTMTGEASNGKNGKKVHIAEGLQKRYLAVVRYLMGDGLDFLIEEIRRTVEGKTNGWWTSFLWAISKLPKKIAQRNGCLTLTNLNRAPKIYFIRPNSFPRKFTFTESHRRTNLLQTISSIARLAKKIHLILSSQHYIFTPKYTLLIHTFSLICWLPQSCESKY